MSCPLTNAELANERKRADALADLCRVHGNTDGATAMAAVARSCAQELVERDRHPAGADRPALG